MKILRLILYPLVPVYYLIIKIRNLFFDINYFKTKKVDAQVISVGNLTVGGSGKTPLVIYLTKLFKDNGKKVGVLSRGYGRKSSGYLLVSDGKDIFSNVKGCSDEIYHTVLECMVPAAVCENRVKGAERLINESNVEYLVLDDAFQHRWIYRNLNLLVFEQRFLCEEEPLKQKLLPAGFMREPFSSVKRADAVIVNRKFSDKKEIPGKFGKYFNELTIFHSYYQAINFVDIKRKTIYKLSDFEGQVSLVVSGIANPFSFINILKQNKVNTENQLIFRDHKNYTLKEVQKIRKKFYDTNSHSVVTTEKDAVKLTEFSKELDDIDIFYLKIEMKFDEEESFRKFVLNKIN
jgi:tetraacyldisaccharide 4'-kinase